MRQVDFFVDELVSTGRVQSSVEDQQSQGWENFPKFPTTRYQGSKRKILLPLGLAFSRLKFTTALDLFSGSGSVSLLLRWLGKQVTANDYLLYNSTVSKLLLTASSEVVRKSNHSQILNQLLSETGSQHRSLVRDRYCNIFFTDEENHQIDCFAQNVAGVDEFQRLLYLYAVGQALMKKRPYNLFHRANLDMRLKEVKRTFGNAVTWATSIHSHAMKAIQELQSFPFDDLPPGKALNFSTSNLDQFAESPDLIYLDPPYLNSKGAGTNYGDFYGFLDGLCDYELFASGDTNYPHKPISKGNSRWLTKSGALDELHEISSKWSDSIIFMSYRSDGQPTPDELAEALSVGGKTVERHSCGEFKYALSRTDTNEELFLLSIPSN